MAAFFLAPVLQATLDRRPCRLRTPLSGSASVGSLLQDMVRATSIYLCVKGGGSKQGSCELYTLCQTKYTAIHSVLCALCCPFHNHFILYSVCTMLTIPHCLILYSALYIHYIRCPQAVQSLGYASLRPMVSLRKPVSPGFRLVPEIRPSSLLH